jgi:hypothetical protein
VPEANGGSDEWLDLSIFLSEAIAVSNKFDPVTKRVSGVETLPTRKHVVPYNLKRGLFQSIRKGVDVSNAEGRMRLFLGHELSLDAKMNYCSATTKPTSPSTGEGLWFNVLSHTNDIAKKCASPLLLPGWHR